jgi:hypothetical protein
VFLGSQVHLFQMECTQVNSCQALEFLTLSELSKKCQVFTLVSFSPGLKSKVECLKIFLLVFEQDCCSSILVLKARYSPGVVESVKPR